MVYQISGITRRINRVSTSGKTVQKLPLTNRSGLIGCIRLPSGWGGVQPFMTGPTADGDFCFPSTVRVPTMLRGALVFLEFVCLRRSGLMIDVQE